MFLFDNIICLYSVFFFFGWVFCSKGQPTVEFIFSASEETIFVHVIISAKLVKFHSLFLVRIIASITFPNVCV
jgi:uncharacterized membrane protein YcgQ (UPF0703/DUF1980 family)